MPAPLHGGHLLSCKGCSLGFRSPSLSESQLDALYSAASAEVWESPALRCDQQMVLHRLLTAVPEGDVLDVGCFGGALLVSTGDRYRRYGVEISAQAADKARSRGIDVIASRFSDLHSCVHRFDAVCAIDVIEHVHNPMLLLRALASLLKPRGVLLISTGDFECSAFRLARSQYWYCRFPEHISFISERWARNAAADCSLDVVSIDRFAYGPRPELDSRPERARFLLNAVKSRAKQAVASLASGNASWARPKHSFAAAGLFTDHILIALRPSY